MKFTSSKAIIASLFFIIGCALFPTQLFGASQADQFIHPLPYWSGTGTKHGEEISEDLYHMGVDDGGLLGPGAPVYATANGIVREAQERSQFGLVILIEHTLPNGKNIVSLYGHMSPSDMRVQPGQEVRIGEVIGVIGDSNENGGWAPHLHFGIHKQPYTSEWVYYGHVHDPEAKNAWYKPNKFIRNHSGSDKWRPSVRINGLENGQLIDDTLHVDAFVGDKGTGIARVLLRVRMHAEGSTWATLFETTYFSYPFSFDESLDQFADGEIDIRIVAYDRTGKRTRKTVTVHKSAP